MWEWVTEEGGRKERNKSDRQTKSQLIQEESPLLWGGIMLLVNPAQRDRPLWSHQSLSEAKAWFSLSPNGSLPPLDGMWNWDIEALSEDNLLLCILEVQPASLQGISQRNSRSHSLTTTVFPTRSGTWIFLAVSWPYLKTQLARIVSLPVVFNISSWPQVRKFCP